MRGDRLHLARVFSLPGQNCPQREPGKMFLKLLRSFVTTFRKLRESATNSSEATIRRSEASLSSDQREEILRD